MLTLARGCHSATVSSLRFAVNHAQTFNLKRQHLIINYCKSGWWHISLFKSEIGPVSQTSQNTGLTVLCFDEIWWKTAPFYAEDMSQMFHVSVLPHDFPCPDLNVHIGTLTLFALASRCLIASFPVHSLSELQLCGKLSFSHIVLNKKTRHARYLAE